MFTLSDNLASFEAALVTGLPFMSPITLEGYFTFEQSLQESCELSATYKGGGANVHPHLCRVYSLSILTSIYVQPIPNALQR